eukprot:jgi/Botrbrau1/7245/Bobra.0021s0028.1
MQNASIVYAMFSIKDLCTEPDVIVLLILLLVSQKRRRAPDLAASCTCLVHIHVYHCPMLQSHKATAISNSLILPMLSQLLKIIQTQLNASAGGRETRLGPFPLPQRQGAPIS